MLHSTRNTRLVICAHGVDPNADPEATKNSQLHQLLGISPEFHRVKRWWTKQQPGFVLKNTETPFGEAAWLKCGSPIRSSYFLCAFSISALTTLTTQSTKYVFPVRHSFSDTLPGEIKILSVSGAKWSKLSDADDGALATFRLQDGELQAFISPQNFIVQPALDAAFSWLRFVTTVIVEAINTL